jgi:hypothetical protein
VKRASSRFATKKKSVSGRGRGHATKQVGHKRLNELGLGLNPSSRSSEESYLSSDQLTRESSDLKRLEELPKEVGAMLIAAGIVGLVLPGPGTPALIAGGVALWPAAFSKLELWLERRYPNVHKKSMKQIGRFLDDLEKRYPY